MWAHISISAESLYTIPVGIAQMHGKQFIFGWGPLFAGLVGIYEMGREAIVLPFLQLKKRRYLLKLLL